MLSSFTNPHLSSTTKEILGRGRLNSTNVSYNDENNVAKQNLGDKRRNAQKPGSTTTNVKSLKTPGSKLSGQQPGRRAFGDISNRKNREFGATLGTKKNLSVSTTKQPDLNSISTQHRNTTKKIDKHTNLKKNVSFRSSLSNPKDVSLQPSAVNLRSTSVWTKPCLKQKENLTTTLIQEKATEEDDSSSVSSIEFPAGRMYHQEPDFGKNDLPPVELNIDISFDEGVYMTRISEHYERKERLAEESFERRAEELYQEDLKSLTKSFGYPEDEFTLDELLAEDEQFKEDMRKRDYDFDCDISL